MDVCRVFEAIESSTKQAQQTYFLDAKSLQTFVEKMQTKFQEIKIL